VKPIPPGNAVELAGDVAVVGEDEVGPDDARDVLLEAVLARELHDLLGLAAIELFGDERRRGAARAAQVEGVERPVEGEQVVAERLDRGEGRRLERKRVGTDSPGDAGVGSVGDAKESAWKVVGDVPGSSRPHRAPGPRWYRASGASTPHVGA
jgi:hypothetical protein